MKESCVKKSWILIVIDAKVFALKSLSHIAYEFLSFTFFLLLHQICNGREGVLGSKLLWVMVLLHGYKRCIQKERKALLDLKKYLISNSEGQSEYVFLTWTNDQRAITGGGVQSYKQTGNQGCLWWYVPQREFFSNLSLLYPFWRGSKSGLIRVCF